MAHEGIKSSRKKSLFVPPSGSSKMPKSNLKTFLIFVLNRIKFVNETDVMNLKHLGSHKYVKPEKKVPSP